MKIKASARPWMRRCKQTAVLAKGAAAYPAALGYSLLVGPFVLLWPVSSKHLQHFFTLTLAAIRIIFTDRQCNSQKTPHLDW